MDVQWLPALATNLCEHFLEIRIGRIGQRRQARYGRVFGCGWSVGHQCYRNERDQNDTSG